MAGYYFMSFWYNLTLTVLATLHLLCILVFSSVTKYTRILLISFYVPGMSTC